MQRNFRVERSECPFFIVQYKISITTTIPNPYSLIGANSLSFQEIVFLNILAVLKYLCIFKLKNPGAIIDEFWSRLINLWVFGFGLINYAILMLDPHSIESSFLYSRCVGQSTQSILDNTSIEFPLQNRYFLFIN